MSANPPIPNDITQVDPAWLTLALQAGAALDEGAKVESADPGGSLPGIAVTSRVHHLLLTCDPPGAGPPSVIVKLVNPDWKFGPSLYEREVRFFRELAAKHALPVPSCYHADWDPNTGAFVLVLEDLTGADPGHRLDGLPLAEGEALFDTLSQLHGTWWEREDIAEWPGKNYSTSRARKLLESFNARWPQLISQGKYAVSGAVVAAVRRISEAQFADGLLELSRGPRTLIHSDVHAENLLLDGSRVVLIDWQNASYGHCAFDVAGAVCCLRPEVLKESVLDLLHRYHDGLVERGVTGYARDTFRADVAAALRWLFTGVAGWLVVFEAESLRDASTIQGHWERISTAICTVGKIEAYRDPEEE